MGRKMKRWRSKAIQCRKMGAAACYGWKLEIGRSRSLEERNERLDKELAAARQEIRRLNERLAGAEELACFRAAVRRLPFGGMGGGLYEMRVTFDPQMVEYGLAMSRRPGDFGLYNLSAQLHYMVEEMAHKLKQELHRQLANLDLVR